jgi:DNA-binding MarR family transcriptional regulator
MTPQKKQEGASGRRVDRPVLQVDMFHAAGVLREAAGRELHQRTLLAFLLVAQAGKAGLEQQTLIKQMGGIVGQSITAPAVGRHVAILTDEGWSNGPSPPPGLKWVRAERGGSDQRHQTLYLTDLGREVYDSVRRR